MVADVGSGLNTESKGIPVELFTLSALIELFGGELLVVEFAALPLLTLGVAVVVGAPVVVVLVVIDGFQS